MSTTPESMAAAYAASTDFGRRVWDSANNGRRYDHDWLAAEIEKAGDTSPEPTLEGVAAQVMSGQRVGGGAPTGAPSARRLDPVPGALQALGADELRDPEEPTVAPPGRFLTQAEEAARAAAREKEIAGFFEILSTSFRLDSSTGNALEWLDGPMFAYDPDFEPKSRATLPEVQSRIDGLTGADMEEVGDILGSALNAEHFDYLLAQMEKTRDEERMIAEAGLKGFTTRIAANLVDPIDAAVALVPGAGQANKLNKLRRAIRAGLAAGASSGTIEAIAAVNNPYRGKTDIAFATAGGFALGGALGGLSGADNARLRRLSNEIAQTDADETSARALDSVGAARRVLEGDAPLIERRGITDDMSDPGEFKYGWAQKLQQNYIGRLLHDTSDVTRKVASRIIEGGFLKNRGATRGFTAEGRAGNLMRTYTSRFYRETTQDFRAWAAKNGYSSFRQMFGTEAGERFYNEVGRALRGADDAAAEAKAAATHVRKMLDEYHAMAREVGLPGFVDAEPIKNFLPRNWADGKIAKVLDDIGPEHTNVLGRWFTEALVAAQDDIEEAVADRIGMGFARAIVARGTTLDDLINHGIPLTDMQRARELLGDIEGVDEIIDTLKAINAKDAEQAGKIRHGKQRLRIDENYSAPIRLKDGTTRHLSLDDLTITDARKVVPRYFQTMGGAIALAKEAGIKSEADINRVIAEMAAAGDSIDTQQAMRDVINLVRGVSVERDPYSGISQLSRVAAAYDYVRFGGQFGFAQIPEIGNIIGQVGIVSFIRNIPLYKDFLSRAADGRLNLQAAREIEELLAPGTDFQRNPAVSSFDEQGLGFDTRTLIGKIGNAVDAPLQRMSRLTQALSLMAPITSALERIASYEIANSWLKAARGGKKVSETRMRAAGLSAADWNAVAKAMDTHAVMKGGRLESLNTHKWDADVRDKFMLALDRERSFNIQRNLIGNTGRYIHTPVGRMLTRFMTFMLNSINQQLLRGVHHRDIQTFVSFSTSMFLGSMVYVAQTSIDYANDDKRRKERLEPGRIAAAAYQRAGFSAITVPIIDSALAATGFDPIFKYGRTSGLGTDLLTGNSTLTGVSDLVNTATMPIRLLHDDYSFSQKDLERIQRLTPFQRLLGVKNAFHAIGDNFPKQSQDR
jgi:hypothetical protein